MDNQFFIKPIPQVRFGVGAIRNLAEVLFSYGNRVLLIVGAGSLAKTAGWSNLLQALSDKGIVFSIAHIPIEPSPELVDTIVREYSDKEIDCVAAIGGGSVLDGGKAVSAMLAAEGSVADYLEGIGSRIPDGRKIPFVAVPTTAGTGSEMTSNAVIASIGSTGYKKSLRHDNYIPNVALIDPELTLECPVKLTTNCAMDAFTQLVESYLSTKSSPYTDDLAFGAISKLKQSLLRVCRGNGSMEDRADMSYAASISGITLTNAGLGVVHGFASVIGGLYEIPHGVVCGTLMASANRLTLAKLRKVGENNSALEKYARLGRLFCHKEKMSSAYYQDRFIDTLNQITSDLKIDTLAKYGVRREDLDGIAEKTGCKNNPAVLEMEDLKEIIETRVG